MAWGDRRAATFLARRTKRMRAYILISVRSGKVRDVLAAIGELNGVKRADACWGMPDVFAYVETSSERSLNHLVIDEIQKVDGVERTETHIVAE
jgi:DNA-binding Lrp family transcriptional regulator